MNAREQTNAYLQDALTTRERMKTISEQPPRGDVMAETLAIIILISAISTGLGLLFWYQETSTINETMIEEVQP